jgi:CTP:molybdopterin cytidylyltransferase MocA
MSGQPAVVGLLLAAGEGKRFGAPKALARTPSGTTWVAESVLALVEGGVRSVYVVVGAAAEEVSRQVPGGVHVVHATDWEEGMGASLRAGLAAVEAADPAALAVVVMLVDTPDVGADVVRRLAVHAGPAALARAAYHGHPGHPVLLGRGHWAGVSDLAVGDRGARDYLSQHEVELVECGDIATGRDVDTPDG